MQTQSDASGSRPIPSFRTMGCMYAVARVSAVHAPRHVFEESLDLFRGRRLCQVVVESGIRGTPAILGLTPSRQGDDSCAGHFSMPAQFLR